MSEHIETLPFAPAPLDLLQREKVAPTTREWATHALLLFVTFLTTTFAGIMIGAQESNIPEPPLSRLADYVFYVPEYYRRIVVDILAQAINTPGLLKSGLAFSIALLTILTAHEMGHYLACRYYRVKATLPFFIPAPLLFLAGTDRKRTRLNSSH